MSDDGNGSDYDSDNQSNFSDSEEDFRKLALLTVITTTLLAQTIPLEPPRIGDSRSDRREALQYVRSWDDDMFRRQFRLCRDDFGFVLHKIAPLIVRNEVRAIASSGSSICPELRLMITLRILAGAKYLDMIWYRVHVDHVHELVIDCVKACDSLGF